MYRLGMQKTRSRQYLKRCTKKHRNKKAKGRSDGTTKTGKQKWGVSARAVLLLLGEPSQERLIGDSSFAGVRHFLPFG
jgi:hypothetical protein